MPNVDKIRFNNALNPSPKIEPQTSKNGLFARLFRSPKPERKEIGLQTMKVLTSKKRETIAETIEQLAKSKERTVQRLFWDFILHTKSRLKRICLGEDKKDLKNRLKETIHQDVIHYSDRPYVQALADLYEKYELEGMFFGLSLNQLQILEILEEQIVKAAYSSLPKGSSFRDDINAFKLAQRIQRETFAKTAKKAGFDRPSTVNALTFYENNAHDQKIALIQWMDLYKNEDSKGQEALKAQLSANTKISEDFKSVITEEVKKFDSLKNHCGKNTKIKNRDQFIRQTVDRLDRGKKIVEQTVKAALFVSPIEEGIQILEDIYCQVDDYQRGLFKAEIVKIGGSLVFDKIKKEFELIEKIELQLGYLEFNDLNNHKDNLKPFLKKLKEKVESELNIQSSYASKKEYLAKFTALLKTLSEHRLKQKPDSRFAKRFLNRCEASEQAQKLADEEVDSIVAALSSKLNTYMRKDEIPFTFNYVLEVVAFLQDQEQAKEVFQSLYTACSDKQTLKAHLGVIEELNPTLYEAVKDFNETSQV